MLHVVPAELRLSGVTSVSEAQRLCYSYLSSLTEQGSLCHLFHTKTSLFSIQSSRK